MRAVSTSTPSPTDPDENKRLGVRELVDLLNKQNTNTQTNKPKAPQGDNRRVPLRRQLSAPAKMREQSRSPERNERAILDPVRKISSPVIMKAKSRLPERDWIRSEAIPTKLNIDIPSPKEGSARASMSRSASCDSKPFLKEIYENPKRRPLSDIIKQFSGEGEPDIDIQRVRRSHSSPPLRRTGNTDDHPRAFQPREGSPSRFGERLALKVSVIDDDMFRKEGEYKNG